MREPMYCIALLQAKARAINAHVFQKVHEEKYSTRCPLKTPNMLIKCLGTFLP